MKELLLPIAPDSFSLRFLYGTAPGRVLLRLLTVPCFSRFSGKFLDSSLSRVLISPFIRKNSIRLCEYVPCRYRSFNDFFIREIRKELRPIDSEPNHLISPCDGLLSVYPVTDSIVIPVKHSSYSLSRLLDDPELAEEFQEGICLVFRLCVHHYHRYCYVDSGSKGKNIHIPGRLHTVRPIAQEAVPVFTENAREYTVINSPVFGKVIQMEVGALFVGKIRNYLEAAAVRRGDEKGCFLYGGSTVIVLLKKGAVQLPEWACSAAAHGCEIPVKMGEMIGIH